MQTITKENMLGRLEVAKLVFILGLEAMDLLRRGSGSGLAGQSLITIINKQRGVPEKLDISDIRPLLDNLSIRIKAVDEFGKMLIRVFIQDSFEIINRYCRDTNQLPLMQKKRWYNIAFHLRNCAGHNWKFDFQKTSPKRFPAQWHGKKIPRSWGENGKEKDWDLRYFTFEYVWELVKGMTSFAKASLT